MRHVKKVVKSYYVHWYYTSHYPCGVLVVEIGSYARSGIGEVVHLLAAVQYINCGAVIWDPPKSVKRSFNFTRRS